MRAARLLLASASLLSACTHTEHRTTIADRGSSPGEGEPFPDGSRSPVEARLSVEGRVVQGTIGWASSCHPRYVHRRDRAYLGRSAPDTGENLLWMASGAALAAGGGYLLARGIGGTTEEQAARVPAGLGMAIPGLFVAGAALHAQLSGARWVEQGATPEQEPEPGPGLVACGPPARPPRYKLALRLPGGLTLPAGQRGDKIGVVLPAGITPPASADLVVIGGGDGMASEGRSIASVDLSAAVAYLASPPAEPRPAAFVAEQAVVSRSCSPSGSDSGCDGIDRDCDGFYDVGCGRAVGALQWTLRPASEPLDFSVTGPDGVEVSSRNRSAPTSGLTLEAPCLDRPEEYCEDVSQNVFTPLGRAPLEGTYVASVHARNLGTLWVPQRFSATLVGRAGGAWWRATLKLEAKKHHRAEIAFAIGPDRDGDAVIDREDACPDEPGPYDYRRPRRGCPLR